MKDYYELAAEWGFILFAAVLAGMYAGVRLFGG